MNEQPTAIVELQLAVSTLIDRANAHDEEIKSLRGQIAALRARLNQLEKE